MDLDARQPIMRLEPHRMVFLPDETGTTTKMTRLRGRSLRGQRLLSKVPFGHWKTQTFIAGLRCDARPPPSSLTRRWTGAFLKPTSRPNWLRLRGRATSSSWTIRRPIKAPPPVKSAISSAHRVQELLRCSGIGHRFG